MATFSLAAIWDATASPAQARRFAEMVGSAFPSWAHVKIAVSLKATTAVLHLDVDFVAYSRAIQRLEAEARALGVRFFEVQRLPKDERESFVAAFLQSRGSAVTTFPDVASAARAIAEHLERLAAGAGSAAVTAAPPSAEPAGAVLQLDVVFETEADFVREYEANLSQGGMLIRTTQRAPLYGEVAVRVRLPDGDTLCTRARVVYAIRPTEGGGVGVEFDKAADPASWARIEAYHARLAGAKPRRP